ncbi:MAG: efflux RND transporter permease subunit [Bryobacterales bacterium]|nr:efflux RND transporter permease subunit [Bryobacterales bacterium]
MISGPFIRRPVATTLLTIALAGSGIIGFRLLPVSPLPQVDFPTINVNAGLPGASPETMASAVATPLERQFAHISGITEMTSSSGLGSTNITLQFDLNRDINAAARDVQAAINAARGNLPANLPSNPRYRKVNPADAPILILAVTSRVISQANMYDAASSIFAQKLSQVSGVGQVVVGGSSLPAVRVELDPHTTNKYGIGLDQVRTVLANANANRPKGAISGPQRTYQLQTSDQLLHAKDYMPLVVAWRGNAPVRVSDLGEVTDSVEDIRNAGMANGQPAVLVIIFRQPGANIIDVVDHVYEQLPVLRASIPPAMQLLVMMDRTTTIRASVHDVELTLMISIGLVILVVFAFLRNAWATFIPSVAVPLSLLGTFAVMYLVGYTLDNLSLMALTISTGFVVDDAIVVIENIARHLEKGMAPFEAALKGAAQVGFTVVSMSSSLIAVFIPILLMGGIVGRLFREFAVVLSIAIVMSMVISLTTTPMLSARFLGHDTGRHGWLYRASEKVFDWSLARYASMLRVVLNHPVFTLLVMGGTLALNVYLYAVIPKGFFPEQDTGRMMGMIQARQSISFQAMKEKFVTFVHAVMSDPDVENVVGFTGGGGGTNTGRMFIALKDLRAGRDGVDQIMARLRRKTARVPGATLFLQPVQDIRVGGRLTGAEYQFTLQSQDLAQLNSWVPKVLKRLRVVPGLEDVNSDQLNRGLEAAVTIDRDTASRLGVSMQDIDATLYDAFGQRPVSTMYTELNQYHVVMEVAPRYWQSPDTLSAIYVRASSGVSAPATVGFTGLGAISGNGTPAGTDTVATMVPLSAVARFGTSTSPLTVTHEGQFPSSTISFNLGPNIALGEAVEKINQATDEIGMPASVLTRFSGTAQAFQESLANEPVLILTALIAVYIVLGVLYESLIHPITILSTLPSAGVGALLALLLCRTELTVIALIGIILLIGIVKKNAIMMIDFALEAERSEGKNSRDAIYEACLLRFRPITMTTLAAMFGGLPLALGGGTGAELRQPLGIAIVGGLLVSQLLTLFTTPVIYLEMDRLRWFLSGRRGNSNA